MLMHNALALEADDDLQPILVRADPNGLAYDRHTSTLFVADGYTGSILRVEGHHQRRIATIDSGGALGTNRIGGLTRDVLGRGHAAWQRSPAVARRTDPRGRQWRVEPRGVSTDGQRVFVASRRGGRVLVFSV